MSTRYWRVALSIAAGAEPAVSAALESVALSVSSMEIAPGGDWRVQAVFDLRPDRIELMGLLHVGESHDVVIEAMPDVDWVRETQRSFPPLAIGRFYVYGSHVAEKPPAGVWPIALDAGIAFGSGEHATTRGCLMAIAAHARRRRIRRALDLGCGSAILAIGLARCGARHVLATDIDRDSVRIARENLLKNGVAARVVARHADGASRLSRHRRFDLAVANILARPLHRLARDLVRRVAPGGVLVLSGLLAEQEREIRARYRAAGMAFCGRRAIGGWRTLTFKRRVAPRRRLK
jgi:ribosomal protein L11 methyltransferase